MCISFSRAAVLALGQGLEGIVWFGGDVACRATSAVTLVYVAQNIATHSSGKRPLQRVAELTEGCTGSDLFEICSQAAAIPLHEHLQAERIRASRGEAHDMCGPPLAVNMPKLLILLWPSWST